MQTLGDLLVAARDREGLALAAPPRTYDYRDFQATAYKTGNLLRHQGVSEASTVAVLDRPDPEPLFVLLGAGLLGAAVEVSPGKSNRVDARVLFGPTADLADYETSAQTKHVGYGSPPDDPSWVHFERDMWSENPAFPETPVDPESTVLVADREYSHAELARAAERLVDELGLGGDDRVAIRASLAEPETVVAGVIAPLLAGATILLPDEDAVGTVAVASEEREAPESTVVSPADIER